METSYSALWHNLMKLREAMASRRQDLQLEGTIEMDAAWFGGIVRKKNKKADRKLDENDRRKAQHKQGKRVIMVVRQRGGSSLMFAADSETREVAITAARQLVRIDENTKFVTDQELAYRDLGAFADHNWVNHKKMFDKDGVNTNLAESSFSRARRSEIGVYHKLSATWMDFYAGEMCWREDRNRMGNLQQAVDILELALAHPQSHNLKGYYQHYLLPKTARKRPEARFDRVHGRMRAHGGGPTEGAEPVPDAGPVVVQEGQPFAGPRVPPTVD
jgi:hypothetical protein